jgi:CHAD domain-containing protein
MEGVKGITPFLKYLYRREANMLKEVEHQTRSISIAEQRRNYMKIRFKAETKLQVPDVRAKLISAVDNSFANVMHRYGRINPKKTETIHRTRIAFKFFRYIVEIIYPLLVRYPADLVKSMNEYQGLMGDIQDIEVLQESLKIFSKKHPEANISPSLAFLKKQHHQHVETFIASMDRLQIFWRITSRQPYP